MTIRQKLVQGAAIITCLCIAPRQALPQAAPQPIVRLAEIEIDPSQLDAYKAALSEEITASIHLEPGVLKLYALLVKGHPNQVRMVEVYRDAAAYQAHLLTPHFRKYKAATSGMVASLKLIETEPMLLGEQR